MGKNPSKAWQNLKINEVTKKRIQALANDKLGDERGHLDKWQFYENGKFGKTGSGMLRIWVTS